MTEREVFTEALLQTNEADRARFLDEACGQGTILRRRLEHLLAGHASGHPVLEHQPAALLQALSSPGARDTNPSVRGALSATEQLAPFLGRSERPGSLGLLGRYDVLEVLGQGGYGIVVKAFDDSLQRVVAIKLLTPHLASTSPPRKRFLREARAVAKVKHENVVQIHAVEEQPIPYLVMEFVDGQTLQEKLDEVGPLDAEEVVQLGRQIALGLAAAHEEGLIHRDVKPANILLATGPEPRAKLTDFGLARAADDASLTQSGVLAGTPMYMAPEQVQGAELDARADLFSLGSVLYTMTAGRPPFRAPNPFAVLKRVAEDTPRPLKEVNSDIPAGLIAVINKLLAKRPDDRFATAREAADALARCLTEPASVSTGGTWMSRRTVVVTAVLLAVLAATAAIQPWRWRRQDFEPVLRDAGDALVANDTKSLRPLASGSSALQPTATSIVVTNAKDDDSPGTLRWAIAEANNRPGEDAITFDPALFNTANTIALTKGPLVLTDSAMTTIHGPAAGLTISGDDKGQVFIIGARSEPGVSPARAWIIDLTIAHGRTTDAFEVGGGVLSQGGSTVRLTGCTLRDNAATHENGGGGAVFNGSGTLIVTNCTFYHNKAVEGGGIKNYAGAATVTNCTFVDNSSSGGAGIYTGGYNRARTVANNCLFADVGGRELHQADALEVIGDFNVTSDDSAPGIHSKTNTAARLGSLGRHGGPTETIPLLAGSPAIDAGSNSLVPSDIQGDQRRWPRISNGTVDIGAYEVK